MNTGSDDARHEEGRSDAKRTTFKDVMENLRERVRNGLNTTLELKNMNAFKLLTDAHVELHE